MKIRRHEDRTVMTVIEYDVEADSTKEAIQALEKADGTHEYFTIPKKLHRFDSSTIESDVQHNDPLYVDETDYWEYEKDGEWVEVGE